MKLKETYNNYIIFNKLKNYIITNKNIDKILNIEFSTKNKSKEKEKKSDFQPYLFYPKQYDKLFWCFYIFQNGLDEFKEIDNKHFFIEKDCKLDFISTIRENSSVLKEKKIKKIETELDIVNSKRITLNSFHAFCLYHQLNVIVLKKNIYYHFNRDDELKINLVDLSTDFIGCRPNIDAELLEKLLKNKIYVENPDRPIRSLSFYKISDLHDLAKKININIVYSNGKSKKKQELYDEIKDFLI